MTIYDACEDCGKTIVDNGCGICDSCLKKGWHKDSADAICEKKKIVICQNCGKIVEENQTFSLCQKCENEGIWIDPMGTVHSANSDLLAAYE